MQIKLLAMLLILWSGFSTAQDIEPLFSMDLPSVVATSPESASLGRYGGLSHGSATGQMSHTIPLYNIPLKSGGWSVSLGYNYSGLKLEGKPSLSGLGWTLMAGGVVNREVRGIADDSQYGYYGRESKRALVKQYATSQDHSNPLSLHTMRKFMSKKWDAEPDKYTVSVAGLNFSFKLDEDKKPVYLSKHAHKVYVDFNSSTFKIDQFTIVASNGVNYFFEEKEQSVPLDRGQEEDLDPLAYTDTSWVLTRVVYPNSEELTFSYGVDELHSYDFMASGFVAEDRNGCQEECLTPNYKLAGSYEDVTTHSVVKRRVLTAIGFPMGSIHFGVRRSTASTPDNRTLYTTMTVQDVHDKVIESYDFEYEGDRDLLTSIKQKGKQFYDFEYIGLSMPSFLKSKNDKACSQDRWGYYNGKDNQYALTIPNSSYEADHKPSSYHSSIGALKKIIYPTRGYTTIAYESNDVREDNNGDYYAAAELIQGRAGVSLISQGPGSESNRTERKYLRIIKPTAATISHYIYGNPFNQHITLRMKRIDNDDCPYGEYGVVPPPFYMYYQNYQEIVKEGLQLSNGLGTSLPIMCAQFYEEYGPDDGSYGNSSQVLANTGAGRFVLLPGLYELTAYTNSNHELGIRAQIDIEIEKGWLEPDRQELPKYVSRKVGGIRVASLRDCSFDGKYCVERRFTYTDEEGFSSGFLNVKPVEKKIYDRKVHTKISNVKTNNILQNLLPSFLLSGNEANPEYRMYHSRYHAYSTEYYANINPAMGTPVYYASIKETIVDGDRDHGYTQRDFEVPTIHTGVNYPQIHKGGDLVKDRLSSEKIYSYQKDTDSHALSSVTQNEYVTFKGLLDAGTVQDINIKHPWGITFDRKAFANVDFTSYSYLLHPESQIEEEAIKSLFEISKYKEIHRLHKLGHTLRKDSVNGKVITTEKTLEYNTYNYEVAKTISQSSTGKVTESTVLYPADMTTPSAAEKRLQDRNLLTTPIESKHYLVEGNDKELLSTQHMAYKNWQDQIGGQTYTNTLPELMQTAQGTITADNPLEDRIVYHKYDYKGNPLEVSKKDGTHVVYIWGYNEYYPIAKIENVTYSDVAPFVTNLKAKSNADIDRTKDYRGTEGALRQALDNLRTALPNAIVATYTYDPLIGITSMTDPKGYTTYYEYDNHNRLDHVTDAQSKVLKKYRYNYKGQITAGLDPVVIGPIETSVNRQRILQDTSVDFTVTVTGGSGRYAHQWEIDGQSVSSDFFELTTAFSTPGSHTITYHIIDLLTEITYTKSLNVYVYAPLPIPTLHGNSKFLVGANVYLRTGNLSEINREVVYKWFVDGVADKNQIGTDFATTFTTPGTYTITFKVEDQLIFGHYQEVSQIITVYPALIGVELTADQDAIDKDDTISFTATNQGGGFGNVRYEWYVDDVKQTVTGSTFDYQFKFERSKDQYVVKVKMFDITTDSFVEDITDIRVIQPITLQSVTVNDDYVITGTSVTYRVQHESGGSGEFERKWTVNGSVIGTGESLTQSFGLGSHAVIYTVKDKRTLRELTVTCPTVHVYATLVTPTLGYTPSKSSGALNNGNFKTGSTLTFTAGNLSNGAGTKQNEWYINGVKQSVTGTTFSKKFTSGGTYTIKFRIKYANISDHYKEKSVTIKVHNPPNVSNPIKEGFINSSNAFEVAPGESATFTINAGGGSGAYRYDWYLNTTSGNPLWSSSNRYTFTPTTSGYYTVYCKVTDTISGYTSSFKQIRVYIRITRDTDTGGGGGDGRDRDDRSRDQQ